MRRRSPTAFPPPRLTRLARVMLAGVVLIPTASLFAQSSADALTLEMPARPTRTKDHQLFVGVDIFVPQGEDMAPVTNVDGVRPIIAHQDGTTEAISPVTGYRWKRVPRVSRAPATVERLQTHAIYSPARDPLRHAASQQTNIMNQFADELTMAQNQNAAFVRAASAAIATAPEGMEDEVAAVVDRERVGFDSSMEHAEMNQELATNQDYHETKARDRLNLGDKDALELKFEVSSPEPLAHAYAVLMVRVRNPDGRFSDATFHKFIGAVGARPRKVYIMQAGFEPGYELVEAKVHLFNHGEEVATNLSDKRLDITAAEARQYLLLDHAAIHRNDTVPAAPVWSLAPPALRAAESPAALDVPLVVEIDETGTFLAIQDSDTIVPSQVQEIVRDLVFVPALENGEPVESLVTINLADYFR